MLSVWHSIFDGRAVSAESPRTKTQVCQGRYLILVPEVNRFTWRRMIRQNRSFADASTALSNHARASGAVHFWNRSKIAQNRPRWRLLLFGRITPQVLDFTLECWSHLLLVASFISHFSVLASHLVLIFFLFYFHIFHHYVSIWSLSLDTLFSLILQLIAQASLSQFSLSQN